MQRDSTRPYVVEPNVQAGSPPPEIAPTSMGSAGAPSATQLGGAGAASGTGLTPNVAGALSYFLGPITGVLFRVI